MSTINSQPTAKFMSFGAGVQSVTQALLIAEGLLERPDAAIFSDTGWEPAAVYTTLDRVEEEIFKPLGIPLYRVNNGVIQEDVLDPNKMRGIPGFTASQPYEVTVVDRWAICPDEACGWRKLREIQEDAWSKDETPTLFDAVVYDLDGPDMAGLFEAIELVRSFPDLSDLDDLSRLITDEREEIMARSNIAVWDLGGPDEEEELAHAADLVVDALCRAEILGGLPAAHDACGSTGRIPAASHTEIRRDRGMLNRKCTQMYKLIPILEKVRRLLGGEAVEKFCRFCGGNGHRVAPWRAKRGETEVAECSVCHGEGVVVQVGPPPAGTWAEQWIGFSTDEIGRVSNRGDTRYSHSRYPLLELDMSRQQCIDYLAAHGWGDVAKSACLGCPFKSNAEWRRMRDTDPQAWAEVVAFDKAYRDAPGMTHQRFLHISRLPLDEAPIDARQPRELKQSTVADQVYAAELALAESGDPDGCSPWACRSGNAVDDVLQIQTRPAA
ncbi:hypothetical protein [Streptomyces antimycoticus]|uniref:hypothetical protein n=1 Tax=Streptomyces antimycoticus TaxID=68175 RepID=UPI00386BD797|nr:hypothetical protein OG751_04325 [Streptomyces antimycoticus]